MSYRLEIGLTLLLALAIAIALWASNRRPSRPSDYDFRSSTYLSGPTGSQALDAVLSRLGRRSERRRTSLLNLATERAHRPAILVLLDPVIPLQVAELEQLARYVRGGGAVLATGEGAGVTECTGWRIQAAGITGDSMAVRAPAPPPPLPPDVRLPRTVRVLAPIRLGSDTSGRKGGGLEDLVKGGEEDSRPGICATLAPFAVDTVVAALSNRPVILRLRYRGGGSITLVADPGWFTNRVWRDTDMPIVALPLLTPAPERPGRVAWDEYHQGFGFGREASFTDHTWSWLRSSPAGWAILQLIAVALVWLAMTAVRFGPARAAIERRRRSPLEHLEALGAGLESAADVDTAVQRLALGLRRRLSRAGRLGEGNIVPWVEGLELAMRSQQGRAAVRRLHYLLTVRDREAGSARVLQTAQAVEDVWEELRPRPHPTRNAS
jgi:hypothetical protein